MKENLANRLNLPIGENLNWHQSMSESHNFMDAAMDMHKRAREASHTPNRGKCTFPHDALFLNLM